jgi:DNA-binding transcriptional LysR family regulator
MSFIVVTDNSQMDTRQLEYFVAVAQELNFTRAAARLFAVQSTVSAGVAALERELGTSLFERSTKRVSLTVAGAALLPEAVATIEAVDRVRSSVAEARQGIRGRLRVGIFTNFHFVDLPRMFGEYHREYPLVDLHLAASATGSTGLADDVRRGRIDLAFMGLPRSDLGGFATLELARSLFVAVVPDGHRLAARKQVSLTDLAGESWVDSATGFGNRIGLDRALAQAGVERDLKTEVSDLGSVPEFVAAGLGVAAIPTMTYIATPGAVAIPLVNPAIEWTLYAVTRPEASPAVAALLDLLATTFAERR